MDIPPNEYSHHEYWKVEFLKLKEENLQLKNELKKEKKVSENLRNKIKDLEKELSSSKRNNFQINEPKKLKKRISTKEKMRRQRLKRFENLPRTDYVFNRRKPKPNRNRKNDERIKRKRKSRFKKTNSSKKDRKKEIQEEEDFKMAFQLQQENFKTLEGDLFGFGDHDLFDRSNFNRPRFDDNFQRYTIDSQGNQRNIVREDATYEELLELDKNNVKVGIDSFVFGSWPEKIYGDEQPIQNKETKIEECPICLESYEEGDILKTIPCFHKFHKDCIRKWFKEQKKCPVCQFDCSTQNK